MGNRLHGPLINTLGFSACPWRKSTVGVLVSVTFCLGSFAAAPMEVTVGRAGVVMVVSNGKD
jgi:hypothetical protein